jgi:hypothetical protein
MLNTPVLCHALSSLYLHYLQFIVSSLNHNWYMQIGIFAYYAKNTVIFFFFVFTFALNANILELNNCI